MPFLEYEIIAAPIHALLCGLDRQHIHVEMRPKEDPCYQIVFVFTTLFGNSLSNLCFLSPGASDRSGAFYDPGFYD